MVGTIDPPCFETFSHGHVYIVFPLSLDKEEIFKIWKNCNHVPSWKNDDNKNLNWKEKQTNANTCRKMDAWVHSHT